MRRVELAYGEGTIPLMVPEGTVVIEPIAPPALADPEGHLRHLVRPLAETFRGARSVAVAFPDNTRPMPNPLVLGVVLDELKAVGLGPEEVVLCCATGTHATISSDAMAALIGASIADRYDVHQHDAVASPHVVVGEVQGTPILLDQHWVEAERRLTTGFVEPHFFAGFSGGPKGVCPGLAGMETILEAHSPARIADPRSTWLEIADNPVHRFVSEAVALCPPDASLDVRLDGEKRLAGAHLGTLPDSHRAACEVVRQSAVVEVERPFDVVVTTNSGLPLDRNLYQAVKGMAAAARCTREGGDILMAASCIDGIPAGSAFHRFLEESGSVAALSSGGASPAPDLWQAQVFGRVLERSQVHLFSEGLSSADTELAHLGWVEDLQVTFEELCARHGPEARVAVLPQGPLSVATVAS